MWTDLQWERNEWRLIGFHDNPNPYISEIELVLIVIIYAVCSYCRTRNMISVKQKAKGENQYIRLLILGKAFDSPVRFQCEDKRIHLSIIWDIIV